MKRNLSVVVCTGFWLLLWQIAAMIVGSGLLLPGPWQTLLALGALLQTKTFYFDTCWTIGRCLLAMALSFGAGAIFAWLAFRHRQVRQLLALPVAFFKAVPVMAIIIYVILLATADWVAVIVCFFMCFPVVYTNLLEGFDHTAEAYLELAQICGLSRRQRLRLLYIPGILPQIRAAVSLISGLSWKAVVAAEVLSVPRYALGYEMLNAKYYLETANLFAYILVIVTLSLLFERGIRRLMAGLEWQPYAKSRIVGAADGQNAGLADAVAAEQGVREKTGDAPAITIKGLCKRFTDEPVLQNLTVTFPAGQVTALMGPSGEGKTTLLRMIAGLAAPDEGTLTIETDGAFPCRPAFLFQEDRLLPWLSVYDNLALGMTITDEAEADRQIRTMARALELEAALFALPAQLSGGMRSRVALGRTFLMRRALLLLDEPFQGIDRQLRKRLIDRLWQRETAGRTVILVTHSVKDAEELAQTTLQLEK